MNAAADDQHRAGLRRGVYRRALLQEAACFQNAGAISADKKDAVRLPIEVSAARGGDRALQLSPLLDIKTDRRKVRPVHAAVGGKHQRSAVGLITMRNVPQRAVNLSAGLFPQQLQIVMPQIKFADDETMFVAMIDGAGGAGFGVQRS